MEIIKDGDTNIAKRRVRFTCKRCGCIFEAEPGEYDMTFHRNVMYYSCVCPTCGMLVSFGW